MPSVARSSLRLVGDSISSRLFTLSGSGYTSSLLIRCPNYMSWSFQNSHFFIFGFTSTLFMICNVFFNFCSQFMVFFHVMDKDIIHDDDDNDDDRNNTNDDDDNDNDNNKVLIIVPLHICALVL